MADRKIFFIVNPKAAHGRAVLWWQKFLPLLPQIKGETSWAYTYAHFSAALQAEAAIEDGYNVLVSIGGDGTAMEVLNGLMRSGKYAEVAILPWPVGTGRDFARMLYADNNQTDLVYLLNHGVGNAVDILEADYTLKSGMKDKCYLFNMCNLGIAAITSDMVNNIPVKHIGKLSFLYAALLVISKFKGVELSVKIDGKKLERKKYAVACFGNGGYIGGGMHACPEAEIDDGFIDILLANNMPRRKIFSFLPSFMKGNHLGINGITYTKGRSVEVDSPIPQIIDFDGEHPGFTPLKLSILPACVTILNLEEKSIKQGNKEIRIPI